MKINLNNSEENKKFYDYIFDIVLKSLKNNIDIVFLLKGKLGSGKTFFVKNLLKKFNINDVKSPTYNYFLNYSIDNFNYKIVHCDFYRNPKLINLPIFQEEFDLNNIIFIEWPFNIENKISFENKFKIILQFNKINENWFVECIINKKYV